MFKQSSVTPSKRKSESSNKTDVKRRIIDIETKAEMVRQFERGIKVSAIAQSLGYAKSTVSSILKDRKRILAAENDSLGLKSKYIRHGLVHEMEKHLLPWIEEQTQNQVALSLKTIQAKACSLFEEVKHNYRNDCDESFTASQGWFYRFKKRANLDDIISCGEVGDVDLNACEQFKEMLDKLITTENYLPEQVFNLGKTVLFLRRMPEASYFQQQAKYIPAFKTNKDRVTLLFGTNVVGHKLKPLLVFRSENPKAFRNVIKTSLPVHYRSNINSWISQEMFEDWFLNCFVSEVKAYCIDKEIPFKILLTIDTLPCYPQHLNHLDPNIKVVFLPSGTSSLLQPMNQGATSIFKALYIQYTFAKAVTATESSNYTLSDFWRDYNILHALMNIDSAWKGLSEVCLRGIWRNILNPSFLNLSEEFVKNKEMEPIRNRIVKFAEELHLQVMIEDINQIVDIVGDEFTNEDVKPEKENPDNNKSKIQDLVEPKFENTEDESILERQRDSEMEITKSEFVDVLDTEIELKQEKIEIDEFVGLINPDGDRDQTVYQENDEDLSIHGATYQGNSEDQNIHEAMDQGDAGVQSIDANQGIAREQNVQDANHPGFAIVLSINETTPNQFGEKEQFPVETMCTAIGKIHEGLEMFKKMDANFSRYTKTEYLLQKALTTYKDLYREKKKQNPQMYSFDQGPS